MARQKSSGQAEKFNLSEAFGAREEELAATLRMGGALTKHGPLLGSGTEHGWFGLLRGFLPGRYGIATGKVVDSEGHQSEQIDLVIYDAFYSPLLFHLAGSTFIPAESVYAAFEVKQTLSKIHLEAAADKANSIRRLHRTSALIPNQFGREIRKDLDTLPILAGLLTSASEWRTPFDDTLRKHLRSQDRDHAIDIGCALGAGAFDTSRSQVQQGRQLLRLETSRPELSLSYFMMRLLHRLQQLGTVGAIDYEAYTLPLTTE
ncbi:DUF6602 domain-containing protein [Streptomyces sp. SID13031]|uniref:DUF6602 domain-containing protein n=1 Tax=Streptomyces sp. SID13031 TaxID=2706046 RepID=UPI0013CAE45A|nr:DUF6602 domain-containing protein [Streptomyces sp. SID13031]NEA30226.1 hypothetical protein [Streptomyces sp. SID13031]